MTEALLKEYLAQWTTEALLKEYVSGLGSLDLFVKLIIIISNLACQQHIPKLHF